MGDNPKLQWWHRGARPSSTAPGQAQALQHEIRLLTVPRWRGRLGARIVTGSTTQFDKKHKAEEFVERTTGRSGFKEQVNYKSTLKVEDKWSGCTDEYSTQVKFERLTYQTTAKAIPKSKKKSVGHY